jgi:enoyl-CoA hydratase/carnithine racemase
MFVTAQKVHAADAMRCGLVDGLAEDPIAEAAKRISSLPALSTFRSLAV